jgi:hypothetical protein
VSRLSMRVLFFRYLQDFNVAGKRLTFSRTHNCPLRRAGRNGLHDTQTVINGPLHGMGSRRMHGERATPSSSEQACLKKH